MQQTNNNYYYTLYKNIKRLKHQNNITKLLIIILIVWNICTAIQLNNNNTSNIPQFTEADNQQIMQLEEIPEEELDFE